MRKRCFGHSQGRGSRTPLGRENIPPPGSARRRRGRGSNSVLPAWYPRTPLRDVTAVVRSKVKCVFECAGLYSPSVRGMGCSQVCVLGSYINSYVCFVKLVKEQNLTGIG
ncbi:PROTEIN POLYCHOME [Salix koriyanagi]|uniref:PROTEIN POLYCHOME n=1 Tax=Salix koriyanagi TaxID=2511006 RepID=A0A9Q0VF45_9ROSI|nr:PROTEIN POLYCHOME [Salix koriyanagi]